MTSNDITIIKDDAIDLIDVLKDMDDSQKHDILMLLTGFNLGIEIAANKSA